MSRSKLSMLSSSTVHLELNESSSTQQTVVDDIDQSKDNADDEGSTQMQHHNSYENTVAESSFREELLSHFERRLSDLGPRSKYPYLQRIDKQQSGGTGSPESTSQSEEMLTRLPTEKGRGTWWKQYTNSRAAKARQQQNDSDWSAKDDITDSRTVY